MMAVGHGRGVENEPLAEARLVDADAVDVELEAIRADVARKARECSGERYARYKAQKDSERAGLIRQKARIVERLKEAKDAQAMCSEDGLDGQPIHKSLSSLHDKMNRILELLERGRP